MIDLALTTPRPRAAAFAVLCAVGMSASLARAQSAGSANAPTAAPSAAPPLQPLPPPAVTPSSPSDPAATASPYTAAPATPTAAPFAPGPSAPVIELAPVPPEFERSDHDVLVGHLAVGYFGVSQLPIAVPPVGPNTAPEGGTVSAPVIGIRYWFKPHLGLDAGLGLALSTGSETVNSTSSRVPSSFGFAAHLGLPIAVVAISHYVFELVPETLIGFTTGSIPGTPDQSLSGFRFDVGARAGAEIHFGFIGVPQLALQASVGLYFSYNAYSWSQGTGSASVQAASLATNVGANPWAIFVNNVSALYYF